MADKKITDLTSLASADAADVLPIVDVSASTTKKVAVSGLAAAIAAGLPNNSIGPAALNLGTQSAFVAANESTGSTSYTDLTTTTDSITVNVPANGVVLLLWSVESFGTTCFTSFSASGANTIAPSDNSAIISNATTMMGTHLPLTGLTPGNTTFKLKYKVSSGTGSFLARRITAIPL